MEEAHIIEVFGSKCKALKWTPSSTRDVRTAWKKCVAAIPEIATHKSR